MKLALPWLALLPCLSVPGDAAKIDRIALVRVDAALEVKAEPARVWAAISTAGGLAALGGFQAADPAKPLSRVGDAAAGTASGDKGVAVCTHAAPEKELRVAFEPDAGHYVCHRTVRLERTAAGTRVRVLERYSDDQPPEKADATARGVAAEMERALAAFAQLVERP